MTVFFAAQSSGIGVGILYRISEFLFSVFNTKQGMPHCSLVNYKSFWQQNYPNRAIVEDTCEGRWLMPDYANIDVAQDESGQCRERVSQTRLESQPANADLYEAACTIL